jgi:hypothetical protein
MFMFYNVCQWNLALVPRYTIGVWPRDTRCSFLHRINKPCWLISQNSIVQHIVHQLKDSNSMMMVISCVLLTDQCWAVLWFSLILFKELKVLGIWEKIRIKKWPVPGIKKIRIKELVSWSRYLKNIRMKEQPVLGISTPSKNCQGDPAGNAGRLRSLQLCVLSLELSAQTLLRCTLMLITNNRHAGFKSPVQYSWFLCCRQYNGLLRQPIVSWEMPVSAIMVSLLFLPSPPTLLFHKFLFPC